MNEQEIVAGTRAGKDQQVTFDDEKRDDVCEAATNCAGDADHDADSAAVNDHRATSAADWCVYLGAELTEGRPLRAPCSRPTRHAGPGTARPPGTASRGGCTSVIHGHYIRVSPPGTIDDSQNRTDSIDAANQLSYRSVSGNGKG